MSSSTPAQVDQVIPGGWLTSKSTNYQVLSFLGQGTFGKVAKCTRMDDMKTVAIKMIKDEHQFIRVAKAEVSTLKTLRSLDSDKCNLVKWYRVFTDRGHICLEFEHLDKSLLDFMAQRSYQPLPLKEIRPIIQQLATALGHLESIGIVHADLKLENVMLVNHAQEPFKVKVIDFGLACNVSATKVGMYIQTRPYRSPEIILGLPFTQAIDMWSLGCMAASLYLGTLLYSGSHEYDMIKCIVETQGQPPDHILSLGQKTGFFFHKDTTSSTSLWKLKAPGQFFKETGIQSKDTRRLKLGSLDDLLHIRVIHMQNFADKTAKMIDVLMFVDMLKRMLDLDAATRITPHQVLEHQFISMSHMDCMHPLSSHVRSCFEIMENLRGKYVRGSLEQPCSRTQQTVQENHPPPTETRCPSQRYCSNPEPCPSAQTNSSVQSGSKRKCDDEDGNKKETSQLSKRHRYTSPEASSHSIGRHPSKGSQTRFEPGRKRKPADDDHGEQRQPSSCHYQRSRDDRKRYRTSYATTSSSSSHTQTQSCMSPRLKRKLTHDDDSHYQQSSTHERKRVRESSTDRPTGRSGHLSQDWRSHRAERHSTSRKHHRD